MVVLSYSIMRQRVLARIMYYTVLLFIMYLLCIAYYATLIPGLPETRESRTEAKESCQIDRYGLRGENPGHRLTPFLPE